MRKNHSSSSTSRTKKESGITSWRTGLAPAKITIYELLKSEHEEIQELCKNILQSDSAKSDDVWESFVELKNLIRLHTKAEEMVFYNTLHDRSIESQDDELRFDVMEGFEEHHMINLLIAEISVLSRSSDRWMAKMKVLSETLQRHIEKEENEIFPNAERDLDSEEAQNLALEFLEEKDLLSHSH